MTEFEAKLLEELRFTREAVQKIATLMSDSVNLDRDPMKMQREVSTEKVEPQAPSPMGDKSIVSEIKKIKRYYFGTPDGEGFEACNTIQDPNNPRVLYVVETIDGINGKFYPIGKGLARFKSNAKTMLLPLCETTIPVENIQSFNIIADNYGVVKLENDFWWVKKKCII